MAFELDDIAKVCGKNGNTPPGVKPSITIINECDVTTIPDPTAFSDTQGAEKDGVTIETALTLEASAAHKTWNFRLTDATYSCNVEGEEDAELYNVTITAFMPKLEGQKTYQLEGAVPGRHIVKFKDRGANAIERIVGEKNNGARVTFNEQSNPKNGYVVTINCIMTHPPYWYNPA